MVSDMLFAGKTLAEVAGYDDGQMVHVLYAPRDDTGRLIRRSGLPEGVEVDADGMRVVKDPKPFGGMYRQVKRTQGLAAADVERQWEEYLAGYGFEADRSGRGRRRWRKGR